MKPKTELETTNIRHSTAAPDCIDHERLAAALADHRKAISDHEAQQTALGALRARCAELDGAIMDVERLIAEKPDMSGLDIDAIKDYADRKTRLQNQIAALIDVRTGIEKSIRDIASDERTFDCSLRDAKNFIWRTIYEGLLPSFDTEPLDQLLIAGSMIGKSDKMILNDLNLEYKPERFLAMAKQFGLPV